MRNAHRAPVAHSTRPRAQNETVTLLVGVNQLRDIARIARAIAGKKNVGPHRRPRVPEQVDRRLATVAISALPGLGGPDSTRPHHFPRLIAGTVHANRHDEFSGVDHCQKLIQDAADAFLFVAGRNNDSDLILRHWFQIGSTALSE